MENKNIIWTNHALERLRERKLRQQEIIQAILFPDSTSPANDGATEYKKRRGHKTFFAIVKNNELGEGIILSCWVKPPNPGTKDFKRRKRYYQIQSGSFIKKLWLTFLDQIGL